MQENLDLGVTSVGITLGSSGTDVSVTGSPITTSGNITINFPTASATNRGLLSSADWTTFNDKQPAGNYVTLDTAQTITAQKVFTTSGSSDSVIITHGSGSGFALDVIKSGNGEVVRVNKTSGSGNAMTVIGGNFEAPTIVKTGGTSSQFLKADGSVDSSTYLTTSIASLTYVTIATPTTITGVKTFSENTLQLQADGTSQATIFRNSSSQQTNTVGSNSFGFNNSNNIYFNKGSLTNAGILVFNNTAARAYTLPDSSGTIALTSDITNALTGFVTIDTAQSITGIKTFTNSILLKNSPSLDGFILQSFSPNALEFGATISGTTYYSSIVFPAGAQSWNLPNASGTIALTSDLSAYLPLTGGTLTGALNGTSASFTGSVNLATSSGDVGIGTDIPAQKLEVIGIGSFNNATSTRKWLINATDGVIQHNFDGNVETQIAFSGGTTYFLGQNVGIGTNSPSTLLQAVNDSDNSQTFSSRWTASGFWSQLEVRNYSSNLNNQASPQFRIMHNFSDGTDNGYIGFHRGSGLNGGFLSFAANGAEKVRITPDNYIRMAAGTDGIQFNGDTAAANALDDYEEGTWTPTVSAEIGSYTTITNARGRYTKVGRIVTLFYYFIVTTKGTGTGGAVVSNLPFSSLSSNAGDHYVGTGLNTSTAALHSVFLPQGSSSFTIYLNALDPITATQGNSGSITYMT
jgi:hypothetical protein